MKKYKNFINENNTSLRDEVYKLLIKAKEDCYDDENSENIQNLKDIIDIEGDLGCSHNSIQILNLSSDFIMDVLNIDEEQFSMMIYDDVNYIVEQDEYDNYLSIIKEINMIFDVDKDERFYFNNKIFNMYKNLDIEVADIYEINISAKIDEIRNKLFFEFETDNITIYVNLIESNEKTILDAIYENAIQTDIVFVGEPNLSDNEEKDKDKMIKKSLNNILKYCKENKDNIINNVIKMNSNEIPNFYSIKYIGGIFLEKILDFDYQKSKILDSNGNVIDEKYADFKEQDLLNKKMIDYKNMKIQAKKFKI